MGLEKEMHGLGIDDAGCVLEQYQIDVPELDKILEERKPMGMVQFMLENGLTEVPERFVQPPRARMSQTPSKADGVQIPLIDFSGFGANDEEDQKVRAAVSNACSEWGFVQVVNHGVAPAVMDAMMDITEKFFALPAEEKEVYKINKVSGCGYGRLFEIDEDVTADWNDRFYATSYGNDQKKTDALPPLTNPPGFQETLDRYGEGVHGLLKKMLSILSTEVGQAPDFFYEKLGGELTGLRTALNFYPPCPEPDLVMGLAPHADGASVITFVQQGTVDGLEVLKDGVWVPVKPIPHAFVINIGDLLQIISNGKFRSVLHRAYCTRAHGGRLSISSFTLPTRDAIVQPAKELCSPSNPPLYKSVKFHDYLIDFCTQKLGPRFIKRYELNPTDVE